MQFYSPANFLTDIPEQNAREKKKKTKGRKEGRGIGDESTDQIGCRLLDFAALINFIDEITSIGCILEPVSEPRFVGDDRIFG